MTAGELAKRYNRQNFRLHPDLQQRATEASLNKLGWIGQVKVSDVTGQLFDGHLRVELALLKFGEDYRIPVDFYNLDEDETKEALLVHDLTSQMADINLEMFTELKLELPEFDNPAFDEWMATEFDLDLMEPVGFNNDPSNTRDESVWNKMSYGGEFTKFEFGEFRLLLPTSLHQRLIELKSDNEENSKFIERIIRGGLDAENSPY